MDVDGNNIGSVVTDGSVVPSTGTVMYLIIKTTANGAINCSWLAVTQ